MGQKNTQKLITFLCTNNEYLENKFKNITYNGIKIHLEMKFIKKYVRTLD